MAALNKKADISMPFIIGLILLIMVFVVLVYFVYTQYSPFLSEKVAEIWGNL